ncbi:MAG: hypothetical protein ABI068_00160 [Ktedonobacterales bacterium]
MTLRSRSESGEDPTARPARPTPQPRGSIGANSPASNPLDGVVASLAPLAMGLPEDAEPSASLR